MPYILWRSMESFVKNSVSKTTFSTERSSVSTNSLETKGEKIPLGSGWKAPLMTLRDKKNQKEIQRLLAEIKDENLLIKERVAREKEILNRMLDDFVADPTFRVVKDVPQQRPILRSMINIPVGVPGIYIELNYVMYLDSKEEWKVQVVQLYLCEYSRLEFYDVLWTLLENARDLFARGDLRTDPMSLGVKSPPGLRGAFRQMCVRTQSVFNAFDVRCQE